MSTVVSMPKHFKAALNDAVGGSCYSGVELKLSKREYFASVMNELRRSP